MKDKFLAKTLLEEEFGLSKNEIAIYLNLVKYGDSTILELANNSGMNRSTVHVNVESLLKKGLATQIKKTRGLRRLILAEPIEKLALILKNKKAKIETAEGHLLTLSKQLREFKKENISGGNIEIRRYSGKEEVKLIYDDVLRSDEIRSYVISADIITKYFPENVNKFIEAHKKNKKMQVWEIMEDSKITRAFIHQVLPERYHCRLTPKQLNLDSIDYLIYDGKVAMIDAAKGIGGIVIENDSFYQDAKAIHQFIWQFLPSYEK